MQVVIADVLGGSVTAALKLRGRGFPLVLLQVIREVGYREPTPTQRQAILIGLKCRDLSGIAKTRSGKTAAFAIPILVYIQSGPPITDVSRNKQTVCNCLGSNS